MSTEQPNEEQNQTTPTIDTRPDSLLMKKKTLLLLLLLLPDRGNLCNNAPLAKPQSNDVGTLARWFI